MAKKKQLAGKKTKLAKLPLTRVLASQAEETPPWGPPPSSLPAASKQLPLSWERAGKGAAGPLAAAYLQVVQDLAWLQGELRASGGEAISNPGQKLPEAIPPAPLLQRALRQAYDDLKDLKWLLSRS
jgi:hypothetical protein